MYLRRERRRAERVPRPLRKDANTSSKINEITQRRQRGTDCPINEACNTATQRDSNISILLGIKDFHSILLRRWRNFPLTSSWPRPFTPLLPPTPHPHFPKTAPTHPWMASTSHRPVWILSKLLNQSPLPQHRPHPRLEGTNKFYHTTCQVMGAPMDYIRNIAHRKVSGICMSTSRNSDTLQVISRKFIRYGCPKLDNCVGMNSG